MLHQAVAVDEEEDRRSMKDNSGDELSKELAFRESRLRKIREVREALETEARQEAEQAKKEGLKNIETIQSDCMTGLDDDSVDVIFLHEILHALRKEKHEKVLKELYRVLKVSGVLSFSDHHMKKEERIPTVTAGGLFRVAKKGEDLCRFEKVPV